jgi:hypothetical protein
MNTTPSLTIAAAFDTRAQAESAIDELWHEKFPKEQIGIAAPDAASPGEAMPRHQLEGSGAEGAAIGAVTGGAIGTAAGALLTVLVPGIGPVLTGGALAAIALGTAGGAAIGGYVGPFVTMGLSDQEARYFENQLKAGCSIVLVKADGRASEAADILRRHGGRRLST